MEGIICGFIDVIWFWRQLFAACLHLFVWISLGIPISSSVMFSFILLFIYLLICLCYCHFHEIVTFGLFPDYIFLLSILEIVASTHVILITFTAIFLLGRNVDNLLPCFGLSITFGPKFTVIFLYDPYSLYIQVEDHA